MTGRQAANRTWQLYRMLIRRARRMERMKTAFHLRQPAFDHFEDATRALADDQLHQHIFDSITACWGLRGVLDLPAMPITGTSLLQLIRCAFRHPHAVDKQQILQQVWQSRFVTCVTLFPSIDPVHRRAAHHHAAAAHGNAELPHLD